MSTGDDASRREAAVTRHLLNARIDTRAAPLPEPGVARRVAVTLALWPMLGLAFLPGSYLLGVVVELALTPVGLDRFALVVTAAVLLVAAAIVTRAVLHGLGVHPARARWSRTLGWALALALPCIAVAEVVSGGRFADAILIVWLVALGWCWYFAGRAAGNWTWPGRLVWGVGPLAVVVVLVLELSAGLFSVRFAAGRDDLTRLAEQVAAGAALPVGEEIGGFEIGFGRTVLDCEVSFTIDGWWRDDDRWIAWCPSGAPERVALGVDSLGGGWYELVED